LYWTESLTGTGVASSYSSNNASVVLIVQDPGDVAIRQTKRYFTYQPGKSQLVFQTFNLNGIVSDITKRVGLFDDYNGLFLELSGGVANLVRRSSSSVFPATLTVPQSSWNLDPLDGTGPSGHNVQWTLTQILVIDYEWLGVGSVRMGFVINGEIVYAHQFNNANVNPYVYMSTPNLPLRYELRGDAVPPPITYATLSCICGSVSSEGGQQSTGTRYGFANTAAVTVSNGASSTLLNLRHETAYPRITIIPQAVNVLAKSNGMSRWELQVGATLSGSAGWPGTTTGYCEINTVDQVTVPGTVIAAGVFSNNAPATNLDLSKTTFTVGSDYAGNSDVLSLVITNLSGGNEQYLSSIDWLALT
jgi:hypothetical protein